MTFSNPLAAALVGTPLNQALEPTQLFEAAVEVANFFILSWLLNRRKFDGQVVGAFFMLYGVARFFLEFLRGDPGRGEVFGGAMTGTQLISICLVIAGGIIWWLRPGMKAVPAQVARIAAPPQAADLGSVRSMGQTESVSRKLCFPWLQGVLTRGSSMKLA